MSAKYIEKEILLHFYFFCCSRIHCYFTFTFFFHFRFLSSPRQLLGSTGCFTISAQRRHNRPSVKRGCAVWSHIFPIFFIFPFFHFYFFHSVFTFYDVAAQPSNSQKGLCGVEPHFLQFSDICRLWTDNQSSSKLVPQMQDWQFNKL